MSNCDCGAADCAYCCLPEEPKPEATALSDEALKELEHFGGATTEDYKKLAEHYRRTAINVAIGRDREIDRLRAENASLTRQLAYEKEARAVSEEALALEKERHVSTARHWSETREENARQAETIAKLRDENEACADRMFELDSALVAARQRLALSENETHKLTVLQSALAEHIRVNEGDLHADIDDLREALKESQ